MSQPAAERRTRLDFALAYAGLGWAVVPLHYITEAGRCSCGSDHEGNNSAGKHPDHRFAAHGVHSATTDPERIRAWWTANPAMNIGIALGKASGIVAVDVDPRNGGDETWAQFVERNGGALPKTAIARTGGGGLHILFRHDPERALVKVGKGVDIKADGGYIVVEPSGHSSGGRYLWDAEADPLDGQGIADAPAWLSAPRAATVTRVGAEPSAVGFLDPQRILDLRAALAHLDHDDYHVWVGTGMALHSTSALEAFGLWDEWSQRSMKYDARAQRAKWATFGARDGLHVESIFVWARDAGWSGDAPRVAVPIESIRLAAPAPAPGTRAAQAAALGLDRIPGVLGELVAWINATAPRPQPLFAVSTALAIGSVVCARRYVGQVAGNFTSLYFFHLGVSGSGKEFASEAINAVLEAAEWPELIGSGSSYASDSAVFSGLHHQPQHITCTDEIGTYLANAKSEGAMHMRAALSELTKVWGNLHGTLRPKFLSTSGLSAEQAAAKNARVVRMPALTLVAMGQPEVFWPALSENSIRDGFLSRLIIIETDLGRQLTRRGTRPAIPAAPIEWIKAVRTSRAGNLGAIDPPADMAPTTIPVPATPEAQGVFDAYEGELLRQMNTLDAEGLANLLNRRLEQSMRVATILAVSASVERPLITGELARWAVRWIDFHSDITVAAARQHMHGSQFAGQQAEVLRVIHAAGRVGATERELCKCSRLFNGLDLRQRRSVLDALKAAGRVNLINRERARGGRPAQAWVAIDQEGDE
jgi:hypothetical protein